MDDKTATRVSDLRPQSGDSRSAEPQPTMYLIMLSGGIPGAMHRVSPEGTRLGRSIDNTVHLPEPSVSRHHALLRAGDDGVVCLTDLASTNGTFLNGRPIPNHTPVAVHDGDRIQLGPSVALKFVCSDACEERYQQEVYDRIVRDALTGLYNRSYFLDQVGVLADRGARQGLGLAILMLDIDHFKRINDTLGHDAGDAVLLEVAGVVRQSLRTEDLVARYGGEEFVVALPIAAPDQATERAERIRRNLAGRRIAVDGRSVRVTVSIGLSFAPAGRPRHVRSMLATADACLYQAKGAGRDRVVCSHGTLTAAEPITREEEVDPRQGEGASAQQQVPVGLD